MSATLQNRIAGMTGLPGRLNIGKWFGPHFIIFAASIALSVWLYNVNSNWLYTKPSWLDSFISIASGMHYFEFPQFWESYYKTARLPQILVEYVLQTSFRQNAAQLIWSFFWLGTGIAGSLWFARRAAFNRAAALVMAMLMAAFPLSASAFWQGGSNYPVVMGSPVLLLALAAMLGWRGIEDRVAPFASGALLTIVLLTYPIYLQMLPYCALLAGVLISLRAGSFRAGLFHILTWSALGALLVVIGLMVVAGLAGRNILFFATQISMILTFVAKPEVNVWWRPLTMDVFWQNAHLGFLFAWSLPAVYAVVRLLQGNSWRQERIKMAIHGGYLMELVFWTVWQFKGQTALMPSYFAYPLYLPAVLSIAALLDSHQPDIKSRKMLAVLAAVVGLAIILALTNAGSLQQWSGHLFVSPAAGTAALFLAFALVCVVAAPLVRVHVALPLVLPVPILAAAMAMTAIPSFYEPSACTLYGDFNRFIIESETYLIRQVDHPDKIFVHADRDEMMDVNQNCKSLWDGKVEQVASSFTMLGSQFLGQPWQPWAFQKPDEIPLEAISEKYGKSDILIAVFSGPDGAAPERLMERFRAAGVSLESTGRLHPGREVSLPSIHLFRPIVAVVQGQ